MDINVDNENEMESDNASEFNNENTNISKVSPSKIRIEPITIKKTTNYTDIISHIEINLLNKTTKKYLKIIKIFPETIKTFFFLPSVVTFQMKSDIIDAISCFKICLKILMLH